MFYAMDWFLQKSCSSAFCSGCWTCIAYNVLCQFPEMLQVIFGPLKIPFPCYLFVFTKNVVCIQYIVLLTAVAAAKYVFIFIRKNSLGQYDDFWCFFTNVAILIHSLIFQFVFLFLPGRKPFIYYQCASPEESVSGMALLNVQLIIVYVLSLAVYIMVHVRIKLYQLQFLRADCPTERQRLEKITKSTLSSFFTLSSVLVLFTAGVSAAVFLNTIDPPKFKMFPYHHLALLNQHALPLAIFGHLVLSYYVSNAKLRDNVHRELKSQLMKLF